MKGEYGSFGYDGPLELHRAPEVEKLGLLGELWRPWDSNLEVTGSPVHTYLDGASNQTFFVKFSYFFVRKMRLFLKIVAQIRSAFGLGGELPWGPHRPPPPVAGVFIQQDKKSNP